MRNNRALGRVKERNRTILQHRPEIVYAHLAQLSTASTHCVNGPKKKIERPS